jgi:ubiquinone/menaquinone biosynthesis C-methylase UbiE
MTWKLHLDHQLSVYRLVRARHVFRHFHLARSALEIGCGGGTWTPALAARSGFVVAIDLRPDRIVVARGAVTKWERCNVGFAAASGEMLPFPDRAFDAIVSIDVIEHIPDDQRVICEAARLLRPGGQVVMTTLLQNRPFYLRKVIFPDHLREYQPEGYIRLFEHAGLEIVEVFSFYRLWSTLAREIEMLITPALRVPVMGAGLRGLLSLLARLDWALPIGRPGGIGVVARKPKLKAAQP